MTGSIRSRSVEAEGMTIGFFEAGAGPLVVLTHGFPDTAASWHPTMSALADEGFRVVAPHTRGLAPTTAPESGDFSILAMGRDILRLMDALGEETAMLVGQDWGAMFSYAAAGLAPERVTKLVTIAIPHPRAIRAKPSLVKGLWHFAFFQLPWLPEWFMSREDCRGVDYFFSRWSPSTDWTGRLEEVKETYREPGTVKAALGYYRSLLAAPWNARFREQQRLLGRRISIPTLTFAGNTDGALPSSEFDGSEHGFSGPYELVKVDDAGHFLHLERPEVFLPKLTAFLKSD